MDISLRGKTGGCQLPASMRALFWSRVQDHTASCEWCTRSCAAHEVVLHMKLCSAHAAPIAVQDSLNMHWHGRDNQTLGGLLVFFFSPVRYEYNYHTSLKETKGPFQQSPVTLGVKASFLHSRKLHAGIKHTSLMLSISTIASPGLIFLPVSPSSPSLSGSSQHSSGTGI